MLAIKFHHLRCLVHRPFLALLSFQRSKIHSALLICVSEARKIVHLLHDVFDERSLLYDFPWWQMIPCLVCAGSVLLSASNQILKGHSIEAEELQAETLHEDADTCLKVFDSLSANFNAARQAMNMMKDLRNLQRTVNCTFCVLFTIVTVLACLCVFVASSNTSSITAWSFKPGLFPTTSETSVSAFDPIYFEAGVEEEGMNWSWPSSSMFDSLNLTTQVPVQFPNASSVSASTTNSFQLDHPSFVHHG
jgi:hypothetical protein